MKYLDKAEATIKHWRSLSICNIFTELLYQNLAMPNDTAEIRQSAVNIFVNTARAKWSMLAGAY